MHKTKIAVIGLKGLPGLGGTASVGECIINELKYVYDFTVYAIDSHANINYIPDGFKQIIFKSFFFKKLNIFYYYLVSAFHALFKGDYDLVHLHLIDGAYILPILRLKYKVISTSHGRPQEVEKWNFFIKFFFKINERMFLIMSNKITCVSLALINKYNEISHKKIVYIPNGVTFQPQTVFKRAICDSGYILFSARRLIPLKGCHLLLDALAKLHYVGQVKIIGDLEQMPEYSKHLKLIASDLQVEFIGLISDKQLLMKFIAEARLFIFPSTREAMSVMLLEVASVCVPLVCSDIPENKTIFGEDEVLFFSSGNADDLATKIDWALNNYESMTIRAEKAYQKLNSQYKWTAIAKLYQDQFQNMLKDKK
jgi:glycosyltransferase involved in cell wall biosynthesis